jgi:hypothetical protein
MDQWELTKYVVGAKANPPKKLSNALKNGNVMATNIVNPARTYKLHLISLVFRPSEFRLKTSIQSSDRAITDIDTPGNETEHQAWTESKLPDQHRLYHVKHRHRIYLSQQPQSLSMPPRLVEKHVSCMYASFELEARISLIISYII